MQEKLKSLQNIMSQRGYNKSASTARENTDLKSNLKSLQDILVKRGYTPKSVPSEQKSKTRHKEKGNNLFEETSKSTFETMPKYQEAKQKHQEEEQHRLNATYNKYGIDPNNFSYDDFSKWAEEHNFNRIPHNDPLEAGYDWLPNEKGVSKEVKKDKETLEQLALNNQRKNIAKEGGNAPDTFITSLMDGATLGGRSAVDNLKSQKKYKEAGLNVNDYVSEKQANAKSSEEHPIASTVGDLAGSTVSLIGLGEAVGGALKGVKWLAKTPTWVQGAIKNGIVFGLQQGTEATADGKKAKDIAKETAIGVVGGAVGGAASSTVEDFAENILFKTKLQHKFIPEMIRNGVAGASFAGADSAATYFLHPKEERPTAKDVAKNMAVTFAFATITSAINMGKIKQSSKEALDVVNDKMMKDYEGMMNSASTNDVESVKQFAKNVMDYSDSMIKYLDGEGFKLKNNAPSDTVTEYLTGKGNAPVKDTVLEKARFVGEDARVRSMQEDLRTIKSRAKEFYDRADSIPYDVEKISKTSNVGNVDNITKEPTNINNTNPTPQNKNSIQNVPKTPEAESIQTVQEQTPISAKTNDVEVQKTDKLPKEVQDSVSKADVVAENNPQGYNKDFVRRYANSFVEVAQKSDNYPNRDFLDNNIADELTQKILTGESKLDGNSDFDYAVKQFKFILNQADESKLNQVQQFNENQKQQNDVSASEINTDNSIINDTADGVNSADTPTTTDTAFNDAQENGVQSSVNRVTEEVHNAMNKIGLNVSESTTGIQEANTKFMSNNDNLFDRNYVSNYANDFVQAMSEKSGRSYTVLSQETDNLADELVNKTLTGNSVLDGNREFQTVVRNFKEVLREGIKKNANLHNNVYGANEALNAQVQDIENGDYSSLNIAENLTDSQASNDMVEGPIRTFERPSKAKSSKVLKQIARESIKNYNSKIQLSELDNKVSDLYNAMQNGIDNNNGILNNDTSNTAWEMAENIASDVADNIEVEDETTNEEEYKRLRSWVYNTPLKISDQDKSDLMGSDSFNDFRKNNFGTLRLTNDGIPVDSFYGELSNMFPQYFNSEVQTHPADQLQTIQNVIERLKPKKRSLTRQEYNDVVQQLTVDIFSRVMTYVLEGKNEVETENNKLYDSNTFGLFEPFGGDFVVKQDIEYKQEFANNAFKVKIKNGKYQLKDGITYGHFGMHANSKGDIIITYLPIGKAVAVVPDRQQADKFVIEAEKNTKKYLLYLYKTENGEIAVGGDVNSFMNVIKNIQSDIKDKYTTDDVQSNEPQNNDSVTENDNAVQTNDNATQTTETEQKEQHTESISDDNVTSKVTLAPLTGSQKQINWAEAIRKDFYDKWVHRAKTPEEFDFLNYIFQTKTDSSEWIDNESRSSQTKWLREIHEEYQKSKSGMIDNSSNDIPNNDVSNNDVQNNSEVVNSEPLADKCSVIKTQHTKTGEDLWVVELKDKISADEYKKLNAKVKEVGGYYSRYAKTPDGKPIPGFIFKKEPSEEVADVFNAFFDTTGDFEWANKTPTPEETESTNILENKATEAENSKLSTSENEDNELSENKAENKKEDFEVGDILEIKGKHWRVKEVGFDVKFENVDKNDVNQTFSTVGGMEYFKKTHDYKVIKDVDMSDDAKATETLGKVSEKDATSNKNNIEKAVKNDIIKVREGANEKSQQVANFVEEKLQKGEKFTSDMLFKKTGKIYDGSLADNTFTVKDAYDAMELGINQYILNMKEEPTLDKMFEIIDKIPTQTKRTEGMDNYQQFSTPPTLAYLASYAANINSNDIMLEPSAGIGGIATFAKKSGAKVIVNELDPRRMAILKNMPFDDFYSEDAEQINNILGGDIEPSVVVMNPPFSSSTTRNMKGAKIGAKHIEEALKMLKTNGRLVAITGKTMADDAPAFRNWWNDIKKKYNVVANIGISGKNFNKYGTNFGIQMMVIDNNGATKNTITDYVEDLHDLQSILGGIRNERPILDYSANEQRTTTTTRKEIATTRTKGSVGDGTVSDASSEIDTKQSSDKGRVPKHRNAETEVLRNDGSGGNTVNQRADKPNELDDERRLDGRRKSRGNDELQDVGRTDKSDSVEHSVQSGYGGNEKNGGLRQNSVGVQRLKKKELTDNVFEEYKVAPLKVKNAKPHPAKLSESAAMSAVKAPDITYKPHIDQKLIDEGTLSSAQLEVVSRAGQCHSQTLPNGETRGFFCGDGTGVGKGRTVAGIILDNFNQGRKKAVWISKGHDLLKDTLDYTKDVFGRNDMVVEFNGGKKADSSLKSDDTILYLTYNKLSQGWNKENSNFEKIVSWLGQDFDGVIAFDEAHMMSNAGGKVTNRGKAKPSETALAGIELQKLLPKAKVIYMSATGATEVENLQYATRLGLWGEGTAFPNEKEFISQIKGGGISAMEMLAQDLKMEGVYLSRNISYEDVTYDKLTHKLTKEQKKMYNTVAKAWQIVFQNLNEALKETHQSSDGTARGQVYGKFWSSNQRFFNQILVSMQTPSVIKDIKKQLAKGKSCIIQLTSTNEAQGKRELARLYEEGLTLDDYDVSPKQMLMEYVEKSFPVQQYEEYKDEKGNVKSKPAYNSKGEPVLNREAVRKRDTLLDQLGSMKAPSSPIDMIINAFGTDLVAENTGRSSRVINVDGKNVQQRLSNNTRSADVEAFQNGKKRIMIFSEAGGTGKSYHASKAAKNQQQRVHYLLEAGWKASTAVQGFGRSHRSNQVSAPIFKLVTTDLKGQSRFISTIAKRLAQLGSLTKGQRQAGSQGMFSEDDNLENAFSATVLKSYITALAKGGINDITNGKEIISKLGLNVYNSDGSINQNSDDLTSINKFLNRILSLEYDEQNEVFDEFDSQLKMAMAEAEQNGTLDKGMENYKADKVSVKETKTVHTDKLSGAETLYYSLVADKKIKKNEFSDIQSDSPRFKGFYQNKANGGVRAITQIANKTDSNGNVVSRFKAEGQEYGKTVYLSEQQVSQRWNKIDNETAKALWNKRLEEMPGYRQENVHLISGAVLPVWDKLPETNIKVYRILTDNGDVLIGRVIPENAIDSILRRLGANRTKGKVDVSSVMNSIKNGDVVYLENGWSLKQRKVANEQRIELTGPRFENYEFIKKLGVFSERISYQTRFFIPTKTNTENIIKELMQYSPYSRTETEMQYNKGDDGNGWEVKKPEQEKQIESVEDDNKKTSDKSNADIRYSKQANNLDSWTSDVKQSSKNQKNKKLGDIVSYISKKFNIPISKGNLSLTRAKGEFKKLPKAVRLRIANDLPTATHELGHLLDDEYDFTSSANIDEIIDFAQRKSPTLMKQYKKSEVPDEAVAEFVREFVKDPQSTIKEVPKFSKEFIETLSPKDAQALKTLSEYSQQYYNSDFMDKVDAAMTSNKEIKKKNKPTASEISKEIYTKLVDSFAPIKEATDYVKEVKGTLSGRKDAYILAINSKNVDATMSTIFKEGMVDPNGNLTGGKGLIDCIKDISHKDIDLFDKYLVLKHSLEWIEPQEGAKLKRVFSDDTLQNSERIKREIANLENSHPEFKEASENLYKFQQDMLKYWVVSMGGMDAITYNKLQKMYPHYVPFMRDTGRNRTGFKSGFANQQSPVKTAKGSGATIISPLESIIKNVEKQVKFGTRNRVMAVLGMYADNVPGFANFIEPVPPDQVKNIINIEKLSDEFLGRMSESLDENDLFNLTEAFEDVFGTQVESYTPVVIPGKQIVTYLNKGKHKYYQVHDKALFNAITNLTPVQTGKIMNFAGRTLGITNALITQLNPVFATTNAIRDYDTAMKNSKAYNNPITFTGAYMSALWDVIRNSDNYKQYKAAGGGHMSMFSDNIDVLKKTLREVNSKDAGLARRLAQAIFLHPIECVTKINEITEAIPRLAEFKGMKKKGADNQQAIYAASDITVNFNRSGEVGRKLNKIFRFSNATVQGMDKQARIFTSGGKKEIAKHMLRYLISAILTTALLEFWNRTSDEDGWEELSQYQKNNFYCISIGNGKFIKIPKAREAAILNTTTERAADYAFGDKEAFYQFGQYIGDTTLPAWLPVTGIAEGGIEEGVHQAAGGTILGGIVDNMVNKDFKGTPIVSSALEEEPNKEQYNKKTSLLAKSIGQTFNWSPMKIDHLIDNYTGIIGKFNRSVTADGFNPSNLYGTSFSADSAYSTDVFNRVYEQRDKMQKKYQNEPTPQNACLYEKYATKAAYITQANKAIKKLSEDEQRTARKELIADIKATGSEITDTDKGIVNSFSNGLLTSDNGYVDSLPKSTITKTKNKQSYTWEMTYSEYKKYYDDYRKEVEKQRKKLLNTSAYKRASDIEKTEMLKQLSKDVLKDTKEKYKNRNALKFKKDE